MKKLTIFSLALVMVLVMSMATMAFDDTQDIEVWVENLPYAELNVERNMADEASPPLTMKGEAGYYVFNGVAGCTDQSLMNASAADKWGEYDEIAVVGDVHGKFDIVSNTDIKVDVSFNPGSDWFEEEDYFFEVVNYLRNAELQKEFDGDNPTSFNHTYDASGLNHANPNDYTVDLAVLLPKVEKYEANTYKGTVEITIGEI